MLRESVVLIPPGPSLTFVCDNKYENVCTELIRRGWRHADNVCTKAYDLKWRNYRRIDFSRVNDKQIVNHLQHSTQLSMKALLAQHLQGREPPAWKRSSQPESICATRRRHSWKVLSPSNSFYPRTYLPFKPDHLVVLLHHALVLRAVGVLARLRDGEDVTPYSAGYLETCVKACKHLAVWLEGHGSARTKTRRRSSIPPLQFTLAPDLLGSLHKGPVHDDNVASTRPDPAAVLKLRVSGTTVLSRLCQLDPQLRLCQGRGADGDALWVVKPCGGSCGQGIRLTGSYTELIEEVTARRGDCVVQKMIESPLLVQGRKFDIRLWVLVTNVNPLVVWEFSQCYLRFASRPIQGWGPESLADPFVHLCNHAVQKNSPEYGDDDVASMWPSSQFAAHLRLNGHEGAYDTVIRPAMRKIVVQTLLSCQEVLRRRGRGMEWLGFDLMLDDQLQPWLLEVNTSPDLSHSTNVTAPLVQAATADLFKLLLDENMASMSPDAASPGGLASHRITPELSAEMSLMACCSSKVRKNLKHDKLSRAQRLDSNDEVKGPCWRCWYVGETIKAEEMAMTADLKGSEEARDKHGEACGAESHMGSSGANCTKCVTEDDGMLEACV